MKRHLLQIHCGGPISTGGSVLRMLSVLVAEIINRKRNFGGKRATGIHNYGNFDLGGK